MGPRWLRCVSPSCTIDNAVAGASGQCICTDSRFVFGKTGSFSSCSSTSLCSVWPWQRAAPQRSCSTFSLPRSTQDRWTAANLHLLVVKEYAGQSRAFPVQSFPKWADCHLFRFECWTKAVAWRHLILSPGEKKRAILCKSQQFPEYTATWEYHPVKSKGNLPYRYNAQNTTVEGRQRANTSSAHCHCVTVCVCVSV